jgi:hypothetical protein
MTGLGACGLLHGSALDEPPEGAVSLPRLRIVGLRDGAQKHRRRGDVLASTSEVGHIPTAIDNYGVGLMCGNARATCGRWGQVASPKLGLLVIKLCPFGLLVDAPAFLPLGALAPVGLLLFWRKLGRQLAGAPSNTRGGGVSVTLGSGVCDIHHEAFSHLTHAL